MDSQTVPLGCKYKFEPEDHELLVYLLCKSRGEPLPAEGLIREVDLYQINDPGLLFERTPEKEKVVYVFTKLKKIVKNGKRVVRGVSGDRTWKGVDGGKLVYDSGGCLVGEKKNFVFVNKMKMKLGYSMTEFSLDNATLRNSRFKDYVVCKIKKKAKKLRSLKYDDSPEEDASVSMATMAGSEMDYAEEYEHDEGSSTIPYQSQEECHHVSEEATNPVLSFYPDFESDMYQPDALCPVSANAIGGGYQHMDNSIALNQCQYQQGEQAQEVYQSSESKKELVNFIKMISHEDLDKNRSLINSESFNPWFSKEYLPEEAN